MNGGNQLIGKLVTLYVDNVGIRLVLTNTVGNGIEQMGFAHAGRSVNEQGIIYIAGIFCNGLCRAVGKAVGRADHKAVKGKLGVKVHRSGLVVLRMKCLQLLVTKDQQLDIGVKQFLHCFLDIIGAALADGLLTEFGRSVQNQVFFRKLNDLCIVKPS